MNIKTLTQKDVTKIFKEYWAIAFPGLKTWKAYENELHTFIDYVTDSVCDGYRIGIQGWPHTKLKIEVEPGGHLKFWIYPNGENFTTKQKKILKKLDKWAEGLSNERN